VSRSKGLGIPPPFDFIGLLNPSPLKAASFCKKRIQSPERFWFAGYNDCERWSTADNVRILHSRASPRRSK